MHPHASRLRWMGGALLLAASGLLSSVEAQADMAQAGHWLFRHFVEKMDCLYDVPEVPYWQDMAQLILAPPEQRQASPERLVALSTAIRDMILPFDVVDPVVSLSCPLGAAAALQQLASTCVTLLGELCAQRALRLLHLAKLFVLFNFNDFGAWFAHTRWEIDMTRLSTSMQELTAVVRSDEASGALRLSVDSDFREQQRRFALVTYCNYNDSATNLTAWSRSSKQAYADKHGYKLFHFEEPFVTQAHPWMNKLIAIQTVLHEYDWVFWVDCDLFFMNPASTIDAVVKTAETANPEASLIIAEDGMMLNSGSFLLKNNQWGLEFLTNTVDLLSAPMPYSFQHMPWHEQAPLMYLALVPSVLSGLGAGIDDETSGQLGSQPLSTGYSKRVSLMAQHVINSYPPELVQKTAHALSHEAWKEGDMVISFNGCSSVLGAEFCEAMYQRYNDDSLRRFVLS